jgi:hypothetical protein
MLTELEQLVANSKKFFSPIESDIINKIKNNISTSISPIPVDVIRDGQIVKEMSSIGKPPPLNPLGEFTDVVVAEKFAKSLGPGRPKGTTKATDIPITSEKFTNLEVLINKLVNSGYTRDIVPEAIGLDKELQRITKDDDFISLENFNSIDRRANQLYKQFEDFENQLAIDDIEEDVPDDFGDYPDYPGVFD